MTREELKTYTESPQRQRIFETLGKEMLARNLSWEDLEEGTKEGIKEMVNTSKLTWGDLVFAQQVRRAIFGDTKAAVFVRDTIGEKPTDKVEQTNYSSPLEKMSNEELAERVALLEKLSEAGEDGE